MLRVCCSPSLWLGLLLFIWLLSAASRWKISRLMVYVGPNTSGYLQRTGPNHGSCALDEASETSSCEWHSRNAAMHYWEANQFILEKLMPKCDFGATKLKQCFPRAKIKQKLCAVCLCLFVFLVFLCLTGQGSNQLAGFEVEMECGLLSPKCSDPDLFSWEKQVSVPPKVDPKDVFTEAAKWGSCAKILFFCSFRFSFFFSFLTQECQQSKH